MFYCGLSTKDNKIRSPVLVWYRQIPKPDRNAATGNLERLWIAFVNSGLAGSASWTASCHNTALLRYDERSREEKRNLARVLSVVNGNGRGLAKRARADRAIHPAEPLRLT